MPDSLLQRSVGSTYWCSLTKKHRREELIERGKISLIVNPKQTSNLNPSLQAKTHFFGCQDTAHSSFHLLV